MKFPPLQIPGLFNPSAGGAEVGQTGHPAGSRLLRQVISCSRRTDVPGFYLPWLLGVLDKGCVELTNPYNGRVSQVDLSPERVHTLVFWSKNYGPFFRLGGAFRDFHLFFIFTLNDCPDLEWNVPPLGMRVEQMRQLVEEFGPQRVQWRYDPLILWRSGGAVRDNFRGLLDLAEELAPLGLTEVVTSFAHPYNKVRRRMAKAGLDLHCGSEEEMVEAAAHLAGELRGRGIQLLSCCNDFLLAAEEVERARCIDGALLSLLAGEPCSVQRDPGQRPECTCTRSVDIGSYQMACPHNCVYCYATPAI